jgi:hypothetical protein
MFGINRNTSQCLACITLLLEWHEIFTVNILFTKKHCQKNLKCWKTIV